MNLKKAIITLSTVPKKLNDYDRYGDRGIKSCILSLCEQTYTNYEIHFNIPMVYKLDGSEYVIPEWLNEFTQKYNHLKIFRTEDSGPITKIIYTLERITDPETILIVLDDDLVYHKDMVTEHVKNQTTYETCACGYDSLDLLEPYFRDVRDHFVTLVPVPLRGRVLQHYKSVSYKRRYFENDFWTDFLGKTTSDDILLSAYMGKQKIDKLVVPYEHEKKAESEEEWRRIAGVCTFPVLRHTAHDPGLGCSEPKLGPKFFTPDEFVKKGYLP